ncbi:hypothetical protein ACFSTC_42305 [Nonomuraea ferruginea]
MLIAIAGALIISTSGPLVRLADVAPATSAIFRCAYAIPPLIVLATLERQPARAVQGQAPPAGVGRGRDVRARPVVLAPLDRVRGRRAGHGARQSPGVHRGVRRLGDLP